MFDKPLLCMSEPHSLANEFIKTPLACSVCQKLCNFVRDYRGCTPHKGAKDEEKWNRVQKKTNDDFRGLHLVVFSIHSGVRERALQPVIELRVCCSDLRLEYSNALHFSLIRCFFLRSFSPKFKAAVTFE